MRISTAAVVAFFFVATSAHAAPVDLYERIFGVSNTNAVAGHGGLTAGIAQDGDLSLLSWPSPSYNDQLAYVASNAEGARALPHAGALDGMGSYIGFFITTAQGTTLSFLRDAAWTHAQRYTQADAPVPVTTCARADLGLTVVLTDVVSPSDDVLTRHVQVTRAAGSPVTALQLAVYENLSPTLSRFEQLPFADWLFDSRNDFLAAYDNASHSIIHFHPGDRAVLTDITQLSTPAPIDYGAVETLMTSSSPSEADVAAFVAALDTSYTPGVAALVTTEPAPTSHQVGADTMPLCANVDNLIDNVLALPGRYPSVSLPIESSTANLLRCKDALGPTALAHGWTWSPRDALEDLKSGSLSGSSVAAAQTNGALIAPLTFDGAEASGAVVFAFGATRAAAQKALAKVQAMNFGDRQAVAEKAAHDALSNAALPDASLGARVVAVAQRALVNVYVARDRQTGAVVASVARQPPYSLDWPRDGAFIDATLDVAGLSSWVTQRTRWYAGLQRTAATLGNPVLTPSVTSDPDTGQEEFPAGAWEMNYFADGKIGGNLRFEIDNTALHVWSTVAHAALLSGEDQKAYVNDIWPADRAALELLARWRERKSGLPAPANEDDNPPLTSKLHGAVAVHAALVAGARLANLVGDADAATRYDTRATSLGAAIVANYFDASSGFFRSERGTPGSAQAAGPTAWLVWPGRVLDASDPRVEKQLSADMDLALDILRGGAEGGSYLAKNTLAAALYGKPDGARAKAKEAVQRLAALATADTLQFGEVYMKVADALAGGAPTFENRVAAPHVWQGVLLYLSAMALSDPSRFNPEERTLPLPKTTAKTGCGCGTSGVADGVVAVVLIGILGWRRKSTRDRSQPALARLSRPRRPRAPTPHSAAERDR